MEKQKLFVIKCFPCAWPSSLTCIITFRRVHHFGSVHQLSCAFVRRNTLRGREVSAFSLLPSFFFLPQLHFLQTLTHHYFWPEKQPIVFTQRNSASITLQIDQWRCFESILARSSVLFFGRSLFKHDAWHRAKMCWGFFPPPSPQSHGLLCA